VKDKLGIAPIPGATGAGASSLGGHNLAVSVYSKNKATALDFLKFMTSEESEKFYATQGSLAPVLGSLYTDKDLVAKLPYLPVLKTSIENAVPRPVTPFYPAVTKAIQENAYSAIKGEKPVDTALSDMQNSIESAGAGSSVSHGHRSRPDPGQRPGVGRYPDSSRAQGCW
jgi:multiple sugar transport system substrate-binding protein